MTQTQSWQIEYPAEAGETGVTDTQFKECDIRRFLPVGFVSDATVDYTENVQNAIDSMYALGGGTIKIPPHLMILLGTVGNNANTPNALLNPKPGVSIVGADWTCGFKVADDLNDNDIGGFQVFYNDTALDEQFVGNQFRNFLIDFNGANNLWPSSPPVAINGNLGIRIKAVASGGAHGVVIDNIWFKDNPGANSVVLTTLDPGGGGDIIYPEHCEVTNNLCSNFGPGLSGNTNSLDHSAIFVHGKSCEISGNKGYNDALNASFTTTFIEAQVQNSLIHKNLVSNVTLAINAVAETRPFTNNVVSDNVGYNVKRGVTMVCATGWDHTDITYTDNNWILAEDIANSDGGYVPGVSTQTIERIKISGGMIKQIVGAAQSGQNSRGIYLINAQGVSISNVDIYDMSGSGIDIANIESGRVLDTISIDNCNAIDCGRGGVSGQENGITLRTTLTYVIQRVNIDGGFLGNLDSTATDAGIYIDGKVSNLRISDTKYRVQGEDIDVNSFTGTSLTVVTDQKETAVSTTYTAKLTDSNIRANAGGGAFSVNLPSAAGLVKEYTVKKSDATANAVTVDGDGSETIDGATTYAMTTQHQAVTLWSDGTNWRIKSAYL